MSGCHEKIWYVVYRAGFFCLFNTFAKFFLKGSVDRAVVFEQAQSNQLNQKQNEIDGPANPRKQQYTTKSARKYPICSPGAKFKCEFAVQTQNINERWVRTENPHAVIDFPLNVMGFLPCRRSWLLASTIAR